MPKGIGYKRPKFEIEVAQAGNKFAQRALDALPPEKQASFMKGQKRLKQPAPIKPSGGVTSMKGAVRASKSRTQRMLDEYDL